ncbi:hypothetical protein AKJ47_01740 [candidate division MSBL1 archaeon SCGC-AAA261G05]|uniref:Uncharacterized protein n=1 Tax=candidate division MSBL1 archaeon SCGC-AAA261G05 TaxID=1698276 RepID=A0A133VBB7_9EURY|nr:hypothetical protein AKJ47_01740 [candidate division MSBL1 archaeon SCGC-AAA261G05]
MSEAETPSPRWEGAFEYYLGDDPDRVPLTSYGLRYGEGCKMRDRRALESVSRATPQTMEIWSEDEGTYFTFWAESETPIRFLSKAYEGVEYIEAGKKKAIPPFMSEFENFVGFDAELNHALPYTYWQEDYGILDRLVAAVSGPAWIQLCFADYDWSHYAERAGQGLLTFHKMAQKSSVGSTIGQHGGKIGSQFTEKAHNPAKFLHVRGMLPAKNEVGEERYSRDIDATLSDLSVNFDNVITIGYGGEQLEGVYKWMVSRNLPDPTKFLEMNAEILENLPESGMPRWGNGRELIPGFPLTSTELSFFLSLPASGTDHEQRGERKRREEKRKKEVEKKKKSDQEQKRRIVEGMMSDARDFEKDYRKEISEKVRDLIDSLKSLAEKMEWWAGTVYPQTNPSDKDFALLKTGVSHVLSVLSVQMFYGRKTAIRKTEQMFKLDASALGKVPNRPIPHESREAMEEESRELLIDQARETGREGAVASTSRFYRQILNFAHEFKDLQKELFQLQPHSKKILEAEYDLREMSDDEWNRFAEIVDYRTDLAADVMSYILLSSPIPSTETRKDILKSLEKGLPQGKQSE